MLKKNDLLYLLVALFGLFLVFKEVSVMRVKPPIIKNRDFTRIVPKCYPERHWKNRVSNSCMHCGHMSFITRHWNKDGLYCENCKTTHKGKIAKHYFYDKALNCTPCGHKNMISKTHNEAKINCSNCKMGHYKHYSNNVLKK